MELFGYYCSEENALLAAILTFIWLHFLWETYLKYRQVSGDVIISCSMCVCGLAGCLPSLECLTFSTMFLTGNEMISSAFSVMGNPILL